MELDFIEESIPKITRVGGAGREPEKWEDHIAPLKAEDRAGKDFRVWTYSKRSSAISRMALIRNRLTKAVPHENWVIAVRPVPNVDGEFGVYVSYQGTYTAEEVHENARKHDERSARVKAARAKAEETEAEALSTVPSDTPTAKERVAAARANAS
jgi:hypothetical protein